MEFLLNCGNFCVLKFCPTPEPSSCALLKILSYSRTFWLILFILKNPKNWNYFRNLLFDYVCRYMYPTRNWIKQIENFVNKLGIGKISNLFNIEVVYICSIYSRKITKQVFLILTRSSDVVLRKFSFFFGQILPQKISIISQNFDFWESLQNIFGKARSSYFWQIDRFFDKITIFDKISFFLTKLRFFLTKLQCFWQMSIFWQIVDFLTQFRFLGTILNLETKKRITVIQ